MPSCRVLSSVARVVVPALVLIGGASGALGALGAAGCAMSSPADVTPDLDPDLPGVDAAYDPSPAEGDQALPAKADSGTTGSSSGEPPTDSGTKPIVTHDAGVDAGPVVPVVPKPGPGEVLITEIMYDTFGAQPDSEWIELHSKASSVRTLTGLTIKDGAGRTHVIGAGMTIAPGAYVVLARKTTAAIAGKVPASAIAYEYGESLPSNAGVLLANGASGGVSLLNGPVVITTAPYGPWFSQSGGSSAQLHVLDGSQTTSKASWCLSLNAWTTGSEKGTPGAPHDCP